MLTVTFSITRNLPKNPFFLELGERMSTLVSNCSCLESTNSSPIHQWKKPYFLSFQPFFNCRIFKSTWGAWSQPKRHRELPVQSPALHHSVLQLRLWWTTPIPWRSWLAKAPAYELSVKMCKAVVCSEKAFKADLQRTSWISNIFMYILSNTLVYILLIDTIHFWLLEWVTCTPKNWQPLFCRSGFTFFVWIRRGLRVDLCPAV